MARLLQIVIAVCVVAAVSSIDEAAKTKLEEYITKQKQSMNLRYRPRYHVAPPVGWMNDPNGFSYYKGAYHLFYQYYPYDSKWGPMHWGHSSSPDLVNWKELPTALIPEKEQCFSGSGVVVGDSLILMYTAHENTTTDPFYKETQFLANSTDGINFEKYEGNPVLITNESPDFRDPKVWKHGDYWYVVIGTKTSDKKGKVLLYKSSDLKTWEYLSIIGESTGPMGYMWECPDFFELGGKFILMMSPQGMEPKGDRYKNLYQTGYIIGSFDYTNNKFVPEVDFQELDFGHDFYATQTIENEGKRILVAWFGMWEVDHPEAADGWAGSMTIIRELSLDGTRIIQKPVAAMNTLRESEHSVKEFAQNQVIQFGKTAEINIANANLSIGIELLIEGTNGGGKAWIKWDPEVGKVIVDRGSNDIRQVEWVPKESGSRAWRMFLDASSMELFCGEGEVTFSSRVYPNGDWKVTNLSPQTLNIAAYTLKTSVPFPSSSTIVKPLFNSFLLMIVPMLARFSL